MAGLSFMSREKGNKSEHWGKKEVWGNYHFSSLSRMSCSFIGLYKYNGAVSCYYSNFYIVINEGFHTRTRLGLNLD